MSHFEHFISAVSKENYAWLALEQAEYFWVMYVCITEFLTL